MRLIRILTVFVALISVAGCNNAGRRPVVVGPRPLEPIADTSPSYAPASEPAFSPAPAAIEPQPLAGPMPSVPSMQASYVIKKNDTLWSIAKQVYGNGQRWQDILAANPGLDPKKLRVGQTIALP